LLENKSDADAVQGMGRMMCKAYIDVRRAHHTGAHNEGMRRIWLIFVLQE
jgi:hypothetical protein